jgi:hypothetical protein
MFKCKNCSNVKMFEFKKQTNNFFHNFQGKRTKNKIYKMKNQKKTSWTKILRKNLKEKNLHKSEKTGLKKQKTTSSHANGPAQLAPHAGGAWFCPANGRSIELAAPPCPIRTSYLISMMVVGFATKRLGRESRGHMDGSNTNKKITHYLF